MALAIVVGAIGALLLQRKQRRLGTDTKDDVEAKRSGWIARELERTRQDTDSDALREFEENFGDGEDR